MRIICVLIAALLTTATHAAPPRGLLYDRARSGNGLDLQQAGDSLFGTVYTYDHTGATQWLWIQTTQAEAPSGALTRYVRDASGALQAETVGDFSLGVEGSACPDGQSRPGARAQRSFRFSVDGQQQQWCIEALLPAQTVSHGVLNGAWYAPGDAGWGLFAHFYPGGGDTLSYHTVYYHDPAGRPRWAYAQQSAPGFQQTLHWQAPRSACLGCAASASPPLAMGSADLRLASTQDAPTLPNRMVLSVGAPGQAAFQRSADLRLLSTPVTVPSAASTREGVIEGQVLAEGHHAYFGIPYVRAPVGALRWRAPQALPARDTALRTTQIGPGCPQPTDQGLFGSAPASLNEDCLSLNIWQPATPGPHPVLVWIHGGGLIMGSSGDQLSGTLVYDGRAYARESAVLVSINYRLGPLGYSALRAFNGEAPDHPTAGNYGLLDQIAALQWVRDNIRAFGGDPGAVTIFGESAGGVSTCALLSSPLARGLFHRAVMQSGNCLRSVPSLSTALAQGDQLTADLGCSGSAEAVRACLRALPAERIIAVGRPITSFGTGGSTYGLTVDGHALTETLQQAVASGRSARVPLLIGVNDDEMTTLSSPATLPQTVAGYEAQVRSQFPVIAPAVLARYPASAYPSPARAWQDLLDDLAFTCANRRAADDHASSGQPVYHYALTDILPDPQLAPLESFHGADIVYLFGPRAHALAAERQLGEAMRKAWVAFARSGDPSTPALTWPRYQPGQRLSLELNPARLAPITDYRGAYCDFWAQFVAL